MLRILEETCVFIGWRVRGGSCLVGSVGLRCGTINGRRGWRRRLVVVVRPCGVVGRRVAVRRRVMVSASMEMIVGNVHTTLDMVMGATAVDRSQAQGNEHHHHQCARNWVAPSLRSLGRPADDSTRSPSPDPGSEHKCGHGDL